MSKLFLDVIYIWKQMHSTPQKIYSARKKWDTITKFHMHVVYEEIRK